LNERGSNTYAHTPTKTQAQTHTRTRETVFIHQGICTRVNICTKYSRAFKHIYTHIHARVRAHTHIHTHTHAHTRAHTHAGACAHTVSICTADNTSWHTHRWEAVCLPLVECILYCCTGAGYGVLRMGDGVFVCMCMYVYW